MALAANVCKELLRTLLVQPICSHVRASGIVSRLAIEKSILMDLN